MLFGDADWVQNYAARLHSYSLCNTRVTGWTCVSYAGWVSTDSLATKCAVLRACRLETCFLLV